MTATRCRTREGTAPARESRDQVAARQGRRTFRGRVRRGTSGGAAAVVPRPRAVPSTATTRQRRRRSPDRMRRCTGRRRRRSMAAPSTSCRATRRRSSCARCRSGATTLGAAPARARACAGPAPRVRPVRRRGIAPRTRRATPYRCAVLRRTSRGRRPTPAPRRRPVDGGRHSGGATSCPSRTGCVRGRKVERVGRSHEVDRPAHDPRANDLAFEEQLAELVGVEVDRDATTARRRDSAAPALGVRRDVRSRRSRASRLVRARTGGRASPGSGRGRERTSSAMADMMAA